MSIESLKDFLYSYEGENKLPEKHINIIVAAIELFSEKGFEATTTSEIAKKAHVAEGTIYRYFKTKKDLLMAVPNCFSKAPVSQYLPEDINRVFEMQYDNVEDFLKGIILNRRNFAEENIPIIKVLFQEVPFHSELRDKMLETIFMPTAGKLIKVLDQFREQGQIIDMPSALIAKFIITSVIGHFFIRYIAMININTDEEKEIDFLIQYIMHGICTSK